MMDVEVPIGKAKARFAELIRRVESGGSVTLTRHGRPVARLVPLAQEVAAAAMDVSERVAVYDGLARTPTVIESRREPLDRLLVEQIWPRIPGRLQGRGPDKREREEILGYGERGV